MLALQVIIHGPGYLWKVMSVTSAALSLSTDGYFGLC
jgi:hypothetical protein